MELKVLEKRKKIKNSRNCYHPLLEQSALNGLKLLVRQYQWCNKMHGRFDVSLQYFYCVIEASVEMNVDKNILYLVFLKKAVLL